MLTLEQLQRVYPQTSGNRLAECLPHLTESFAHAELYRPLRVAMYLGQVGHETMGLQRFEERLSYSAERMVQVWPRRFQDVAAAAPYAHNPQRLANLVYADRLGNGDEQSGEGWKFRGRGGIHLTGHTNYARFKLETGVDVIGNPDLLLQLEYAFLAAAKFWVWNGLNAFADKGDVEGATRRIQGGAEGLAARHLIVDRACEQLGALSL